MVDILVPALNTDSVLPLIRLARMEMQIEEWDWLEKFLVWGFLVCRLVRILIYGLVYGFSPRRDGYKSKKFEKHVRRQTFPRNSRGTEFAKEPLAVLSVVGSLKELLWHIIQIASLNLFNEMISD